jgi:hypothetical protein
VNGEEFARTTRSITTDAETVSAEFFRETNNLCFELVSGPSSQDLCKVLVNHGVFDCHPRMHGRISQGRYRWTSPRPELGVRLERTPCG